MKQLYPSPIILLGCRRSGTTLLRKIFAKHSDIVTPPDEPQFILGLYKRFGHTINDRFSALEYIKSHKYLLDNIDISTLESVYMSQHDDSSKALIHTVFNIWWNNRKDKVLIFKHPAISYENNISIVHDIFPDAIYINLIRDPRANISSQLARWHKDSIWRCINLWKQSINNLDDWKNNLTDDRYIELRYEDLLHSPEDSLKHLCKKINIRYTPELLEFKSPGRRWSPGGNESKVEKKSVDISRAEVWKENLSEKQISNIEICCESEIQKYNYEKTQTNLNKLFKLFILSTYSLYSAYYNFRISIKNKARLLIHKY